MIRKQGVKKQVFIPLKCRRIGDPIRAGSVPPGAFLCNTVVFCCRIAHVVPSDFAGFMAKKRYVGLHTSKMIAFQE